MRGTISVAFSLLSLLPTLGYAAPTEHILQARQLLNVTNTIGSLLAGAAQKGATQDTFNSILAQLMKVKPGTSPTTIPQATSMLSAAVANSSTTSIFESAAKFIANGITPGDLTQIVTSFVFGCNSALNFNLPPSKPIYPKKGPSDAPYSLLEAQLLAAIHIPDTFTYGKKPPVILTPGTGSTGCLAYSGNYIKLLTGSSYADPVWLNIPHFLLDDVQLNAEYVAYAINYISSRSSNKNVSVIAWSQGNLDTQWALKYWPSTRAIVSDFISISADFHGTEVATVACPGLPSGSCTPAMLQQAYSSSFVNRLRSNGGDSAFVPTTSVYTGSDEVVLPQTGSTASAFLKSAGGVSASNTQVQLACPGLPAGGFCTHESMLYNPLAFALAMDALTHPGPGDLSRIDLATVCAQIVPPGLGVADVISTEENIVVAAVAVLLYQPKVSAEPPLKSYATY